MRFYEEEGEDNEVSPTGGDLVAMGWGPSTDAAYERVIRMARGNAVVVFSISGCCMCHVVKHLLLGLGVGPTVYEVDQLASGDDRQILAVLSKLVAGSSSSSSSSSSAGQHTAAAGTGGVPAVFVGGKLLGGVERVMACHINGSLVPLLKQAGALWL